MIEVTIGSVNPRWDDAMSQRHATMDAARAAVARQLRDEVEGTDFGDDDTTEGPARLAIADLLENPNIAIKEDGYNGTVFEVGDPTYEPIFIKFRKV